MAYALWLYESTVMSPLRGFANECILDGYRYVVPDGTLKYGPN